MNTNDDTTDPGARGLGLGSEAASLAGLYVIALLVAAVLTAHTLGSFSVVVPAVLIYAVAEQALKRLPGQATRLIIAVVAVLAGVAVGLIWPSA